MILATVEFAGRVEFFNLGDRRTGHGVENPVIVEIIDEFGQRHAKAGIIHGQPIGSITGAEGKLDGHIGNTVAVNIDFHFHINRIFGCTFNRDPVKTSAFGNSIAGNVFKAAYQICRCRKIARFFFEKLPWAESEDEHKNVLPYNPAPDLMVSS